MDRATLENLMTAARPLRTLMRISALTEMTERIVVSEQAGISAAHDVR